MSEPTFGGVSDAARELTKTLKEMQAELTKIVTLSSDLKKNFAAATKAAKSFSSSTGAGGVGAGRPTEMSDSLGQTTDTRGEVPSMSFSGGVGGAIAGARGGGGLKGAAGGFMKGMGGGTALAASAIITGAEVLGTVHQMGRVSIERALEMEWMNWRVGQGGGDYGKLLQQINSSNIGVSGIEASRAAMQWSLMGKDRAGSGLSLDTNLAISRMTGQGAMEGLASGTAYQAPNRLYQLQAMGVSMMNPDGSMRGEADLANQLFHAFYGNQKITHEDLKQSFDPHIGAITQSLRAAGFSDDEIARQKRLFEEKVDAGGRPLTDRMLNRLAKQEIPEGQAAASELEMANLRKDTEFFDDAVRSFAEATNNMAGTINNLVDDAFLNKMNSFGNYIGAMNDAFRDAGFSSIASALGIAGVTAGNINGGSNQSIKTPSRSGKAEGDWNVSKDQITRIHQGEMVLPATVATAVRNELSNPANAGRMGLAEKAPSGSGGGGANVTINVTVQRASDAEAMRFAREVKRIIERDQEMSTLGLGQLVL
jgi:hypothetical protein